MKITRMHGAGNSFVIAERPDSSTDGLSELAVELCGGNSGIRADGLIAVCPFSGNDADFRMLFYNSDGSLGEMCGNGARCVCRYGYEHGFASDPQNIRVMTTAGLVTGKRIDEVLYEVRLNDPDVLDPHRLAEADGQSFDCSYVELGRPGIPHAVVLTPEEDFSDRDALRERGRQLRFSPVFPKGANVTFAYFTGEASVKAVTFERGVEDFTLACGTGCGSTAVSLAARGLLPGNHLEISMPGGELSVRFSRSGDSFSDIYLTGPTAYI